MKITPRYENLYKRALQIENDSKSPRIKALHNQGMPRCNRTSYDQICLYWA
jgi:hypothetical protein